MAVFANMDIQKGLTNSNGILFEQSFGMFLLYALIE
jgi:hypothetical protein